jgi:hypothetical protein
MDLETIVTVLAGFAAFLFFKMKKKSSDDAGPSTDGSGGHPGKENGGRQQLK